ncbi:cell envelope integrity protein TolA [Psychrobacter sp. NG25]|nr:cell envelope integrity protein TolA [Psychrobacter sp. NG25]
MHNAPAVYVPTQPEGNGLTLPTLLSLLAHGLVIGLLVYNYQHTEVDMTGSLETVMVSPEQLADMQGQILANRAAAQAASANSSAAAFTQADASDSNDASQNSTQSSSQQVPNFSRPDDTTGRPLLMSEEHHQRLLEQNREYEQRMAEWAEELDESVTEKHDAIEQDKRDEQVEEQQRLQEYRNKPNDSLKINRPTATDKNIKINAGSSGKAFSLSEDGQPTISGSTPSQSGSPTRSASDSEVKSLIRKNFSSPEGAKGKTALTILTITVNSSGVITSVSTSGDDPLMNKAVENAAWDTKKLPIGPDDPKYPTFRIEYIGSTK